MKGKIVFGLSIVIFILLAANIFKNVDEISLAAKLFIFSTLILLIGVQGFILYHFGKGVRFHSKEVIIPKIFGDVRLENDQILGYQARKSYWGMVLDYSSLTVRLKNGETHKVIVPDAIIDSLKSKFQAENN